MSPDALTSFGLLAANEATFFMPPQSSSFAGEIDRIFDLIFWLCAFFFVLIVAVMVWFVWKYRHRPGHVESKTSSHNDLLEVTWSVIPALLTVWIFVEGVHSYLNLRQPPPDCYEIDVVASKWNWSFQYPNGVSSNELHFPVGRPVKLVMTSNDVLHALYVPDFRTKMDIIHGRYTYLWFEVDEPGTHRLYCAEYCGKDHSRMKTIAVAETEETFAQWLIDEANYVDDREKFPTLALAGEEVFKRRGCVQCHSVDGRTIVGPSFFETYGTEQQTSAGPVTVDASYIRESILDPQAKIRSGFKPQMPSYQGIVSDKEIGALIAFIRDKNPNYHGDEPILPGFDDKKPDAGQPGAAAPAEGAAPAETPAPSETSEAPATETPAPENPAPGAETPEATTTETP